MSHIINLEALDTSRELRHGERFEATLAPVGSRIGARKLGYNVTTVAPGKRAFPFHNHHVYLAVSTMIDCDVWHYPDSKKFGVIAGRDPSGMPAQATFPSRFVADDAGVDYWHGE